ncbi:MAG: homoserine dehydrogenase [Bacillota bacterium]|nr:homoserine dehydrogenase [Bacillota bacterium]
MTKIAILGFGTVGSGVYEVLKMNKESIAKKLGKEIEVKYILDIRDFSDHPEAYLFTQDFNTILEDKEVEIVAEVIGGIHPAYNFTKAALLAGKHVVTSNKELVATMGTKLLKIAKDNNVNYMFEASVGGGIPIIAPLRGCLTGNEITRISGILNGTTNYILTKMFKDGESFEDALKAAQDLGYAERDPSSDILGRDAARKISILMSLVTGIQTDVDKIKTEGITSIDSCDVEVAGKMGCVIKLIARGYEKDGKVFASVSPSMLQKDHPLSNIQDVYNGIMVYGNAVDNVMFYGRGAGTLPTASAVVGDMIEIAKDPINQGIFWHEASEDAFIPFSEINDQYFVRIEKADKEKAALVFGELDFIDCQKSNDSYFISPEMSNGEFNSKIVSIPIIKKIRIEQE